MKRKQRSRKAKTTKKTDECTTKSPMSPDVVSPASVQSAYHRMRTIRCSRPNEFRTIKDTLLSEFDTRRTIGDFAVVPYDSLCRVMRTPKKVDPPRKLNALKVERIVHQFFEREDVSLEVPDARHHNKRYLRENMKRTHQKFVEECGLSMTYAHFCRLRPRKRVKLPTLTPISMAVCEYCGDVNFLCRALQSTHVKGVHTDVGETVEAMWCPVSNSFPKMACVKGTCAECGPEKLMRAILDSNDDLGDRKHEPLTWKKWEKIDTQTQKGTPVKALQQVTVYGTVWVCLKRYIRESFKLSMHLFVHKWMARQYQKMRNNMRPGTLVQTLDFAQNILLDYQEQPTSCHFGHGQATVFCIDSSMHCPGCSKVVRWHMTGLSPDGDHGAVAAASFTNACMQTLADSGCDFTEIIRFTDNCLKQFKSRKVFQRMSRSPIPVMLVMLGEKHAKNAADSITGFMKKEIKVTKFSYLEVFPTGESVVEFFRKRHQSPKAEIDELREERCPNEKHIIRTYFYIEKHDKDIIEDPPNYIQGTTQFHQFRSCGAASRVETRCIGCVCDGCVYGDGIGCLNHEHSDSWIQHNLENQAQFDVVQNKHWPRPRPIVEGSSASASEGEDCADMNDFESADGLCFQ
jgi:hypothetical protein